MYGVTTALTPTANQPYCRPYLHLVLVMDLHVVIIKNNAFVTNCERCCNKNSLPELVVVKNDCRGVRGSEERSDAGYHSR